MCGSVGQAASMTVGGGKMGRLRSQKDAILARDAEFKAAIIKALEPAPEKKRFWLFALVNSAFFLWALSAIVLAFGSTYFSSRRQCMADARAQAEEYRLVVAELRARSDSIRKAIDRSSTREDLATRVSKIGGFIPPFQATPTSQLEFRKLILEERVVNPKENGLTEILNALQAKSGNEWQKSYIEGDTDRQIDEHKFRDLKSYTSTYLMDRANTVLKGYVIKPDCNLKAIILNYVSGDQYPIARLSTYGDEFDWLDLKAKK